MDDAALKRIYSTSLTVALFVMSIFLVNMKFDWALGIMVGNMVGLGLLKSTEIMVKNLIASHQKRAIYGLMGLKYVAVGALIYLLVKYPILNIISFAIGFSLVQLVIFLKAIGKTLMNPS